MKKFGYLGLVRSSDFINGEQLAQAIGLKKGIPQHSDCDWLHFILNDQEILVPTKTFRHSVSWRDIYERGAVYSDTEGFGPYPGGSGVNQNRYVTIGDRYKVTLLKGCSESNYIMITNTDYDEYSLFCDYESTCDSEWSQLIYRVYDGTYDPAYSTPTNPSYLYGMWDQLSNAQLQLDYLSGRTGAASWCQEKGVFSGDSSDRRIVRGYFGVSHVGCRRVDSSHYPHGWRPALRKV